MRQGVGALFTRLGKVAVRRRGAIIVLWVLIAATLNVFVPQLERVIGQSPSPMIPDEAATMRALPEMDRSFGGAGAHSIAFVVLANERGLSADDREYYTELVDRLRDKKTHVASVQDEVSQPALAEALTSRDGKAKYIAVGLWGKNGASTTTGQIADLRELLPQGKPRDLQVHLTGPAATVADMQVEMEYSMLGITIVTVVLITCILLLIYRSLIIAMVALSTVGISLATARAVTALLGGDAFEVSTFTASFLTAVVLGAGVDYSVFLISRFHELLREGKEPEEAVAGAVKRVAAVIIGSAATVIAACSGMALAHVSFFYTTGPAIAVALAVTLLAALTLSPAMLTMAASRGYGRPRERPVGTRRRALADNVVRRPARILVAGLAILGVLAAFYPMIEESYDTRAVQPASTESNLGDALLAKHFPRNELLPEYVLIKSGHDMRNPRDLAALETAASEVSELRGVDLVRGVTRPLGSPIAEASIGDQVGRVADELGKGGDRLADGREGTDGLSTGAEQLSDGTRNMADGAGRLATGSGELADGVKRATNAADQLLNGLAEVQSGLRPGVDGADQAQAAAQQLADGAEMLAAGLDVAHDQVAVAVDGLGTASNALRTDPLCNVDPICAEARRGIEQIHVAERDQLLPGLAQAASAARKIANGNQELAVGATELRNGLAAAEQGSEQLLAGQRLLKEKLGELSAGADEISNAARALAEGAEVSSDGAIRLRDGTVVATQSVAELQSGLTEASDFLRTLGAHAQDPNVGGFYLPAKAMQDPRMALASGMFLSQDGRTARLLVLHKNDPMGRAAMQTATEIKDTTRAALRDTSLGGSGVITTGMASSNNDISRMTAKDFATFALFALAAVLLILILLLRSLVAPLHLLLSVILTFAAAMGISVIVWQYLLDNPLSWSVAPVAFVILVAVGADYNLFLISRIREEAGGDPRSGIARAMIATGSVITTAGVIFAASMLAMLSGSVTILAQIGFTIGVGLLLDTFVVRTLLVPAAVALLGKWNWWPSRPAR